MKAGDKVTWISQSQGSIKQKNGTVIAEISAGHSAMQYVPADTKKGHLKFNDISRTDRVLVAVPVGKNGQITHYYCPYKSLLSEENNPTGEDYRKMEEKNTISKALSLIENMNQKNLSYEKALKIIEVLDKADS